MSLSPRTKPSIDDPPGQVWRVSHKKYPEDLVGVWWYVSLGGGWFLSCSQRPHREEEFSTFECIKEDTEHLAALEEFYTCVQIEGDSR